MKPTQKPNNPCFSSGPCAKRPGWSLSALSIDSIGKSHRSKIGKARLKEVIDRSRAILAIPDDYHIGIVPASDTGAIEMAMWNLLGERGVDVLAWESFGQTWANDIEKQLKIENVRVLGADYGALPDLSLVDFSRDVIFTWNGTTSGVKVPNDDWIPNQHEGLVLCDATSAVFAMDMPWKKLDVITYSWQKAMGGEAAHGMLILSPKAVERLANYKPNWPLPKIFQITKSGQLIEGIFAGETINTPSMLCVEDALDGLRWAESIGGLQALIKRSEENFSIIKEWVDRTNWVDFLAVSQNTISNTSICLKINAASKEQQTDIAKQISALLEKEGVAYDIAAYRDAPPGIRIWGGSTVEAKDVSILTQWLDWAYKEIMPV